MIEWYQQILRPCRRAASANSAMMSRPKGVAITSYSLTAESKRANPSWCLEVMTM